MSAIILVIHLLIALAMIGVILLQKSEGGGLGMSGGGMSGFMTGRSTANLLTRMTAILAACFFVTSIVLAFIAGQKGPPRSIIESAPTQTAPAPTQTPAAPAEPAAPSVPLTK